MSAYDQSGHAVTVSGQSIGLAGLAIDICLTKRFVAMKQMVGSRSKTV